MFLKKKVLSKKLFLLKNVLDEANGKNRIKLLKQLDFVFFHSFPLIENSSLHLLAVELKRKIRSTPVPLCTLRVHSAPLTRCKRVEE